MTIDDLDNALEPLITRRAYIRSLFSTIEGSVWVLKKTLLHINCRTYFIIRYNL